MFYLCQTYIYYMNLLVTFDNNMTKLKIGSTIYIVIDLFSHPSFLNNLSLSILTLYESILFVLSYLPLLLGAFKENAVVGKGMLLVIREYLMCLLTRYIFFLRKKKEIHHWTTNILV